MATLSCLNLYLFLFHALHFFLYLVVAPVKCLKQLHQSISIAPNNIFFCVNHKPVTDCCASFLLQQQLSQHSTDDQVKQAVYLIHLVHFPMLFGFLLTKKLLCRENSGIKSKIHHWASVFSSTKKLFECS